MRREIVIALSGKKEIHGRIVERAVLLEPLGKDFDAIGEIREAQYPDGRQLVVITHEDRIAAYRDRLLKDGEGCAKPGDLAEFPMADSRAVREAIIGFFETPPSGGATRTG
jgi:hypothetical protein